MNLNLIATQGRLIVEALPEEEVNVGGILLAKPQNHDLHFGKVKSIGIKSDDCDQEFELDQTVVWAQYSGVKYTQDGVDYVILNQKDIISIKKED
jgi:co-chaperonin GroES (HSP10)